MAHNTKSELITGCRYAIVTEKKKKSHFCREKKINSEYLKDDFGPDHVKVNFF